MSTDRKLLHEMSNLIANLIHGQPRSDLIDAFKGIVVKIDKHLKDESSPLHLESLPFEPDVILGNPADWNIGDLTSVDIPLGYARRVASWRMVIDCEGELVALVPDLKAEAWRKLLNALGEV